MLVIWNVLLTSMMLEQRDLTPKIEHTTNEFTVTGYTTDLTKVIETSKSKMVTIQDDKGSHSGFVFSKQPEGVIVITALSTINLETALTVTFDNEGVFNATLIGYDEQSNLCVLMTQPNFEVEPFTHASSSEIKQGEFAIAIGSKLTMKSEPVIDIGFITQSLNYTEEKAHTQADIVVQEGTFGGAIINMGGDLMGFSNQISTNMQSTNFLPMEELNIIANKIINKELIIRQTLGLDLIEISRMTNYQKSALNIALNQQTGLYINEIKEDSKATSSTLSEGMIITTINNQQIDNIFDYHEVLYSLQTEIIIEGLKGNDNFSVNVVMND